MKLTVLRSEAGTPGTRAASLADAHGPALLAGAAGYLDFFVEIGLSAAEVRTTALQTLEALEAWRPALAAEQRELAASLGAEPWQLAAVNARTEILATAGLSAHECSTIVHAPLDAPGWSMQTWDWHADLAPEGLLWSFVSDSGRRVKTFTEFGAQAKIGVNDAGIGVHFNILSHADDGGAGQVPVHSVARAVLDEAESLLDAQAIVESAPLSASTAFTVMSREPGATRVMSLEASPKGVGIVRPDPEGWLVRTNHFLDPRLADGDASAPDSRTVDRLARLEEVRGTSAADAAARASALHGPRGEGALLTFAADPTAPRRSRWSTLLTIGIDVADSVLEACPHPPAEAARASFSRI